MQPLEILVSCRSVRRFTGRPVTREQISQILDAARWTGSARNRQPWQVVTVTNPDLKIRLSRLGQYAAHLAEAPVVLVLLSADNGQRDTEFDLGRMAQSISLAAHAIGLGTCMATLYPDRNVHEAMRMLRIGPGWIPNHAMSLGWPDHARPPGTPAIPTGRVPLSDFVTHID